MPHCTHFLPRHHPSKSINFVDAFEAEHYLKGKVYLIDDSETDSDS